MDNSVRASVCSEKQLECEGGLRQRTGMLGWTGLAEFRAWLLPLLLGVADQKDIKSKNHS